MNPNFNKSTPLRFRPVMSNYSGNVSLVQRAPGQTVTRINTIPSPDGRPSSRIATSDVHGRTAQKAENAHMAAGINARHFGVSPFRR